MLKKYENFGTFLNDKRKERDISMRELARQLGISAPFLSNVEKNRCAPLTAERLEKAALILNMNSAEKAEMYDIVGKQRNSVAPDLLDYIKDRDYVSVALRTARDLNASEKEWQQFIEELKKLGNFL